MYSTQNLLDIAVHRTYWHFLMSCITLAFIWYSFVSRAVCLRDRMFVSHPAPTALAVVPSEFSLTNKNELLWQNAEETGVLVVFFEPNTFIF